MPLVVLLTALVLAIVLVWVWRQFVGRLTIYEWERGLRYGRGRFEGVVGPGQYYFWRPTTTFRRVTVAPTQVTVPGQDVLSADAVSLRVSLAAEYRIADPAAALNGVESYLDALYLTLQLALRDIVSRTDIDDLLATRAELGAQLFDSTNGRLQEIGIELMSVDLKDVMFPGELKRTFAQVVSARKEGLAALERARGETAALRNLANAARLMEGNAPLMQLRLLQEIGKSAGNTIVLGLPAATTPLPLRASGDQVELPEPSPNDE